MALPDHLANEVRMLVLQGIEQHAAARADVEALRAMVLAMQRKLTATDHATLERLVPALYVLCGTALVTAADVLLLAVKAPGPAGEALRNAVARFQQGKDPGKGLGRFLTRAAGVPVRQLHLQAIKPARSRDPGLYRVAAGFSP